MASINSLSSYSSLFANKNVISGLASGLDTETLIENAVSGIKLKITNLQQKRTKVEWEQNSLRSIIDKMADFTQKYTSYTSNTNLASASFFNSAVTVRTDGEFAGKVSASGKTSSDIQILGVKQLAKAATYSVSGTGSAADVPSISGSAVDFTEKFKISNVAGSMTVNYGGSRSFDLQFSDSDLFNSPAELAAEIEKQLKDISLTNKNGETVTADSMVGVRVEGGNVVFSDKQNAGNSVYVSSASGRLKDTLGITPGEDATSLQTNGVTFINDDAPLNEYLSGKELSVTLDGLTRTVKLPSYQEGETAEDFLNGLQTALDDAFGYTADGKSKIDLSESSIDENGKLSLKLTAQRGSTLRVAGDAARAMGLGSDDVSTYLDTSKTLGELGVLDKLTPTGEDAKGNDTYKLVINDVTVGEFTKDTALESVLLAINNNDDVGVNVNYSRTTNRIQFTAGRRAPRAISGWVRASPRSSSAAESSPPDRTPSSPCR